MSAPKFAVQQQQKSMVQESVVHQQRSAVTTSGDTLFLGDLSIFATEPSLAEHFARFGTIEEVRIKPGLHGRRNLSYGFIKFVEKHSATQALREMNGTEFLGRTLRIGWASNERHQRERNPMHLDTAQVLVSFISKEARFLVTEQVLRDIFSHYGVVLDVSLKKSTVEEERNFQTGYGFVHYPSSQEGVNSAIAAIDSLNSTVIDGVAYDCRISDNLHRRLYGGAPVAQPSGSTSKSSATHGFGFTAPAPKYHTPPTRVPQGAGHYNNGMQTRPLPPQTGNASLYRQKPLEHYGDLPVRGAIGNNINNTVKYSFTAHPPHMAPHECQGRMHEQGMAFQTQEMLNMHQHCGQRCQQSTPLSQQTQHFSHANQNRLAYLRKEGLNVCDSSGYKSGYSPLPPPPQLQQQHQNSTRTAQSNNDGQQMYQNRNQNVTVSPAASIMSAPLLADVSQVQLQLPRQQPQERALFPYSLHTKPMLPPDPHVPSAPRHLQATLISTPSELLHKEPEYALQHCSTETHDQMPAAFLRMGTGCAEDSEFNRGTGSPTSSREESYTDGQTSLDSLGSKGAEFLNTSSNCSGSDNGHNYRLPSLHDPLDLKHFREDSDSLSSRSSADDLLVQSVLGLTLNNDGEDELKCSMPLNRDGLGPLF